MRLFVDNLTNIDFSYLCPKRGLVGETWLAHIQLDGALDHQGMICDFGLVKKTLRSWLDKTLDHCLLVPNESDAIESRINNGNTTVLLRLISGEHIHVESPNQAITLLDIPAITPASTAEWCINQLHNAFGSGVARIQITFSPEVIDTPYYHYSHGLKKHLGACQRIAHGHRSKVLIWRNGKLCMHSIRELAELWHDIYLGTQIDCTSDCDGYLSFAYAAQQGKFKLTLPKKSCYLIDSDTTVELIAQHLAQRLSAQYPNEHIMVKAFEGIGKGAIAEYPPATQPLNSQNL